MNVGDLGDQHPAHRFQARLSGARRLLRLHRNDRRRPAPSAHLLPEQPRRHALVHVIIMAHRAGRRHRQAGRLAAMAGPAAGEVGQHQVARVRRGVGVVAAQAGRPSRSATPLARPLHDLVGAVIEPAVQHVAGREGDRPDADSRANCRPALTTWWQSKQAPPWREDRRAPPDRRACPPPARPARSARRRGPGWRRPAGCASVPSSAGRMRRPAR